MMMIGSANHCNDTIATSDNKISRYRGLLEAHENEENLRVSNGMLEIIKEESSAIRAYKK